MLIHEEFVLSAAHCEPALYGNPSVIVGQLCMDESDNCGQKREELRITKRIIHPSYSSYSNSYDYMLLMLEKPSSIQPVKFDDGTYSSNYRSSTVLKTCGFGYTLNGFFGPSTGSNILMETSLNYVKLSDCKNQYLPEGSITDSMMCAYGVNTDSCQGDSGGPLYDPLNDVVVGIVSWGYGCASSLPGVYSNIAYEYEWMRQVICANSSPTLRPAYCTGLPTASPTISSAPTVAPTPCVGMNVTVNLRRDNYYLETSWLLYEMENHRLTEQVEQYDEAFASSSHNICLPRSKCYNFLILDLYGDGLISPGRYELVVDNVTLISGSDFGSTDTVAFGSCEVCDPFQVSLTLDTDRNGDETMWAIRDIETEEYYFVGGIEIDYLDLTQYTFEYMFCRNKCYQFEIYDWYGDGLSDPGKVTLSTPFGDFETSDFGFVDYFIFGDSCGCEVNEINVVMDVIIAGDSRVSWILFESDSNRVVMNGVFEATSSRSVCLPKSCYSLSVYDEAISFNSNYDPETSHFEVTLLVDEKEWVRINNERSIQDFGDCQTSISSEARTKMSGIFVSLISVAFILKGL